MGKIKASEVSLACADGARGGKLAAEILNRLIVDLALIALAEEAKGLKSENWADAFCNALDEYGRTATAALAALSNANADPDGAWRALIALADRYAPSEAN